MPVAQLSYFQQKEAINSEKVRLAAFHFEDF
jgi:hypothetical protein